MVFRTVDVVRQAFIKAYIESSKAAEDIFFSHLNALYAWVQEKHGNDEALAMAEDQEKRESFMAQSNELPEFHQLVEAESEKRRQRE